MLSDIVWCGSRHRHIMTSGGKTARAAKAAQPESDATWEAIPAAHTANTQTMATVVLMDSSGMSAVCA